MSRTSNLTGQKFGKLTVLERTDKQQDRYWLYRCRCACGGEILVNTRRLTRGTVTDCGCVPKSDSRRGNIAENLAGQQFGRLSVISRAENRRGRVAWLCRCSCGQFCVSAAHDLKSGHTKSCGCMKNQRKKKIVDISGQRFGRLIALYATGQRDSKGSVVWHCRCDCGNETDVTQDALVHGSYRSCGCLRKENCRDIHKYLHMIDGTCVEWLASRKSRSDNTSGFRGVSLLKNGRYRVQIGFKGKRFYIGTYNSFEEAVQKRLEIERLIHDGFLKAYYTWAEKIETEPEWADSHPLVFEVEKRNGRFQVITE